jgi:hypothetical protein
MLNYLFDNQAFVILLTYQTERTDTKKVNS